MKPNSHRNIEPLVILDDHKGSVNDIKLSSDGHMLLTASSDGTARIYELLIYQNIPQTHQNPQTRLNNSNSNNMQNNK
jgi:WD40 repeat protein